MAATKQTVPDRIRTWVERQFAPKYVEQVTEDMIDVAAGNREGNAFERRALQAIFPEWPH